MQMTRSYRSHETMSDGRYLKPRDRLEVVTAAQTLWVFEAAYRAAHPAQSDPVQSYPTQAKTKNRQTKPQTNRCTRKIQTESKAQTQQTTCQLKFLELQTEINLKVVVLRTWALICREGAGQQEHNCQLEVKEEEREEKEGVSSVEEYFVVDIHTHYACLFFFDCVALSHVCARVAAHGIHTCSAGQKRAPARAPSTMRVLRTSM